nr:ATP-binding protein [Massilia aquatica]
MVERVRHLAARRLPTPRAYEQAIYSRQPVILADQEIWGLTGLAGVGKSSAMRALERALSPVPGVCLTSSVQVPMRPVIHLTIRSQRSSGPVLRSLANPVFVAGRQNLPPAELAEHLRQWLYTQGTQLLIVDELQSMTRGESSSTLIANLVAELNELGPAVVYVFNYSLGHKLLTRNQEDKDRLLAKTLILKPSHGSSQEWILQVDEHVMVAPHLLDIEGERDAPELHRLTGGLCRLLGLLLLEACRISWPAKLGRRVTMADVRAAYGSSAYASQRADIEDLRSLSVSSRLRDRRKDLLCPFPDLASREAETSRSLLDADSPAPAAIRVMESALNHGARHVLQELRAQAHEVSSGERKAATVTKLTRRPALTAEALLTGAKFLSGSGSTKEQIPPTKVGTED